MAVRLHHGKKIDSFAMKRDLDKAQSIENARQACTAISGGAPLAACPVCGGTNRQPFLTVFGFDYHECKDCISLHVVNQPSQQDLERVYKSDYYDNACRVLVANDKVIDYRVEKIARPKVDHIVGRMTTKKKSWLDIGCGVGEILSVASGEGFRCLGIETNDLERNYAVDRFGIEIQNEYFDESSIGRYRGNWGIISMFGVLEHLTDPDAMIGAIAQTQEADDNLVVEVPNFPSVSTYSQMTFPEHINRNLFAPLHLYLFSLKSLQIMFGRHGYEITDAWIFGQDFYEMFSTLGLYADKLNNSILHKNLSPLMSEIQQVIDNHNLGDEILVVAKKLA